MTPSRATYQCLSCRLKDAIPRNGIQTVRRQFSTAPPKAKQAYPQNAAIKKAKREERETKNASLAEHLKPYTEAEKKVLARRYTPAQMNAIEAGEKAVSAKDMVSQGRLRGDAFRPTYVDDFATKRPVLDELKTFDASRATKQTIPGTELATASDEEDPALARLIQQTGLTSEEIRNLRVKTLVSHRVVNQTRMGKIQSQYFLAIAGNENGMLGIGEGKAAEFEDGRRQATMSAIRNMKPIPRYEDRTVYGELEAKVGASIVQLSARPPGFGNRCQHLIFELARAAGISDIAARTPRSRNKMNVVKAAFEALTNQRLPEDIARSRGRKLVDVRNVYYGGQVM